MSEELSELRKNTAAKLEILEKLHTPSPSRWPKHSQTKFPSLTLDNPIPPRWSVAADPVEGILDVPLSSFEVKSLFPGIFLQGSESWIAGKVLRQRAIDMGGNLGVADGQYIIANQKDLDDEFRYYHILLPGTVLCDPHGLRMIAYLSWCDDKWEMEFNCLEYDWPHNTCRLAIW